MLTWENSPHFPLLPLISLRNSVWGTIFLQLVTKRWLEDLLNFEPWIMWIHILNIHITHLSPSTWLWKFLIYSLLLKLNGNSGPSLYYFVQYQLQVVSQDSNFVTSASCVPGPQRCNFFLFELGLMIFHKMSPRTHHNYL